MQICRSRLGWWYVITRNIGRRRRWEAGQGDEGKEKQVCIHVRAHRVQRAQRVQRAARGLRRDTPREVAFGRWPLAAWLPVLARSLSSRPTATGDAKRSRGSRRAESTKVSGDERPSRVCRWQPVLVAASAPEDLQKSQRVLGCHNTKNRSKSLPFEIERWDTSEPTPILCGRSVTVETTKRAAVEAQPSSSRVVSPTDLPATTSWQPSASTAVVGASATFTSPSFPRKLDVAGRRALFTARSVRNDTVVSVRASRFLHGPIWHLARLETGSHPVVARESRPANAKKKKKKKTHSNRRPSFSSRCRRGAPWSAARPNESALCAVCSSSRTLSANSYTIWLILPVVICLSQRLSHACLSTNPSHGETANGSLDQLWFIRSYKSYLDNCGNSRANTCNQAPTSREERFY